MPEHSPPADAELPRLRALAARNALLSEVVLLIARTPDLDRLLRDAVNRFKWALDFECCRLALAHDDGATYDLRTLIETRRGIGKIQRSGVPVAEGLCGNVIRSGRVSLVPGGDGEDAGLAAMLALPLRAFDRVLGALSFGTVRGNRFGEDDIRIAQSFATHLALAIDRWHQTDELHRANEALVRENQRAEQALADLQAAQASLLQAQKMAALGQLTAGIAHEIKNPLNFVNNFSVLSVELLDELKAAIAPALALLDEDKRSEVDETVAMLTGNLDKIAEHGRRADGIVQSMLAHSRGSSGERQAVDLNRLVEEALNLAYHGARAQDPEFNITLERDFAVGMAPVELVPQDITRVVLNLVGNGFYAASERGRQARDPKFRPTLKVTTRDFGETVEIRVRDNGIGIAPELRDRLFQPFFTTKPTGEGTGLGLSISWDIVTQQHGGTITLDSRVGDFTEFTVRLPRIRGAGPRAIPHD
jgi:signal transduction histidine kinase